MKTVLAIFLYHLALLATAFCSRFFWVDSAVLGIDLVWVDAALFGLLGCAVYCMRGLYLHYCVDKDWDDRWLVWHLIRPFVSSICGAVSLLFVKAGLLLLAANPTPGSLRFYCGVYALAFIAGMNVDNFIRKAESVFEEIMGIRKTRASRKGDRT